MDANQFTTMNREEIAKNIRATLDELNLVSQVVDSDGAPIMIGTACKLPKPFGYMKVGFLLSDHDYKVVSRTELNGDPNNEMQMTTLARLMARINATLIHGRFCLRFDSGVITYEEGCYTVGLTEIPRGQIRGSWVFARKLGNNTAPNSSASSTTIYQRRGVRARKRLTATINAVASSTELERNRLQRTRDGAFNKARRGGASRLASL